MLLLFETPAGFALFKVLNEGKLSNVEDLWKEFSTSESARQVVKLKAFSKFENTSEALEAATLLIDSKPSKGLRKFLRTHCNGEALAVADSKLGNIIKEKLKIDCIHDSTIMELMRGVRSQLTELISGLAVQDLAPMSLGLSHSLSRYKLKFSADKVDTMIIQAIGLLDDLDKELNTYAMRVREWYGWHFPELAKIVQDNILYAKTVKLMGSRTNAAKLDFSEILPEEVETELKEAAMISMGTEVSDLDLINIKELCDQVLSLSEYRAQLYDYLKSRMNTIAPNLTALVGELVGARLIAHGGSLLNLAKQPRSTVQILGAEKALFRALKTKHATPKYGLIHHASLIVQAAQKACIRTNYKSWLKEAASICMHPGRTRSCPSFKATVNFNGETFESPSFCSTLRQAEHAAAEVALNTLANRGPSRALAARDETGVYNNLLQETAHRAGLNLPVYTTIHSGPGHVPVFSCTVELAGLSFTGEPARTKKQAQKNAAMAA